MRICIHATAFAYAAIHATAFASICMHACIRVRFKSSCMCTWTLSLVASQGVGWPHKAYWPALSPLLGHGWPLVWGGSGSVRFVPCRRKVSVRPCRFTCQDVSHRVGSGGSCRVSNFRPVRPCRFRRFRVAHAVSVQAVRPCRVGYL